MLYVNGMTQKDAFDLLMGGAKTHVRITFAEQGKVFTDDDISATNGITINGICNSNTDLAGGDTVCCEVIINFINDGQFDGFDWTEEFKIEFGIENGNDTSWCNLGYFRGDKPTRTHNTQIINFVAYDRMREYDVVATDFLDSLELPCSLCEIYEKMLLEMGDVEKLETSAEYVEEKNVRPMYAGESIEFEASIDSRNTNFNGYDRHWLGGQYLNILPSVKRGSIDRSTGEFVPSTGFTHFCSESVRLIEGTSYYLKKPSFPSGVSATGYYIAAYKSDGTFYGITDYAVGDTIIYTCPATVSTIRIGTDTSANASTSAFNYACFNISDPDVNGRYIPYENIGYSYKYDYYRVSIRDSISGSVVKRYDFGIWDNDIYGGYLHVYDEGIKIDITHKKFEPIGYWQYDDVNKVYYSDSAKDYVIIPEDDDTVPDMYAEGYKTVSYNDGIVATETCVYIGQDGRIYCKSGQYGFWDTEPQRIICIPVQTENRSVERTGKVFATTITQYISVLYGKIGKIFYYNEKRISTNVNPLYQSCFSFVYNSIPFNSGVTYREILSKIAEMNGCFAVINTGNELQFKSFTRLTETWYRITSNDYYNLSLDEILVPKIYGVRFVYTVGNLENYLYPSDATTDIYNIYDNFLLLNLEDENQKSAIAQRIKDNLRNEIPSYSPGYVTFVGNFMLEPGDIIYVVDTEGNAHWFPIFYKSFTWNGAGQDYIECTGGSKRSDDSDKLKAQYKESNQFIKKYTVQSGVGISEDGLTVSGEKSLYNISQARDIINNGIYDDQGMDASFGSRHKIYDKANTAYVSFYPAVNMHVSGADSRVYSPGFVIEGMHGGSSDWKIGMNYKRIEGETYTDDSPGDPTFGVLEGSTTLPERYILNGFSRIFGDCVQNNLTTEGEGYVLDARQGKILYDAIQNIKLFPDPTNILFNKMSSGSAWTYTATENCYAMVYATDGSAIKATLNDVQIMNTPYTGNVYSGSISLFLKTGDTLKITSGRARGVVLGLR